MTNVYDVAYGLEKAIRESDDFKNLKMFYENVTKDETSKRMLDNFRYVQMELQEKQMMGQSISEEEVFKAQQQFELLQQHETISKLMQAEERMSVVMNEITKVIMKPLEELYGLPNEQK